MADSVSAEGRSAIMRNIRSKGTQPELRVRQLAHRLGYRFRLHRRDLPGCPDLVFPAKHAVIFVHGCFWHQHRRCLSGRLPTSNVDYWTPKLMQNVRRGQRSIRRLRKLGWRVLVLWECQLQTATLAARINRFLRQ